MTATPGQRSSPPPSPPMLSVIVPTYRREELLSRALRSVLDEQLPSFEILVIDDSDEESARGVVEQMCDPRVRYHPHGRSSGGRPATVRNFGMTLARGKYLYFLDDDDQVHPGGLARLVAALEANTSAGMAFGTVTCIGPDDETKARYNEWFQWAARSARKVRWSSVLTVGVIMFRGTLIINSCCMIRASVAHELGGYDDRIAVYEDVEFFTRAIRLRGHVFVDHPVLIYSTGLPSIIHDLDGDWVPVHRAYEQMHDKYKRTYGLPSYRLVQVLGKYVPVGHPVDQG